MLDTETPEVLSVVTCDEEFTRTDFSVCNNDVKYVGVVICVTFGVCVVTDTADASNNNIAIMNNHQAMAPALFMVRDVIVKGLDGQRC